MTLTNLLTEQAAAILAHKIVSSEQVRTLESVAAQRTNCTTFDLMQRAGEAAFMLLKQQWPDAQNILVVAGNGNNAGDGYVLAKLAKKQGLQVVVMCQQPSRELAKDARQAQLDWQQAGGQTLAFAAENFGQYDVLVDALLGTGLDGQIKPEFQTLIKQINQSKTPVLSIDLPSGMQADTGQPLPICIKAAVTITFVATKPGLVSGIGKEFCGKLFFADLAIGADFFDLARCHAQLVDWQMLQPIQARAAHANKGTFGKLLCIGANQGMPGAMRLCGEAALRSGVGLVKVFCHASSGLAISAGRPEIMLNHTELKAALDWSSCIIIGPGLGQDDWARQQFFDVIAYLKNCPKPVVIDADGLNILATMAADKELQNNLSQLPALVLTPHPGEASRLLNCDIAAIENNRYLACQSIAKKYQASCVLKGAGTIMHTSKNNQEQLSYVCKGGNPGMATAGMGDLLTGIVGAFLAQGFAANQAAIYAVCAHAEAGDRNALQYGQRGMIAADLLKPLRAIVNGI